LLLDLVCTRYPGRKPSDYFEDLDEVDSFSLDIALATKSNLIDADLKNLDLANLHTSIDNVSRSLGAKVKQNKYKPIILGKNKPTAGIPDLQDVLAQLGGAGVVVKQESQKDS